MNKTVIKSKIGYYNGQLKKALKDYLNSTRRQDRDRVLKLQTRLEIYEEVLAELLAELKD